MTATTTIPTAAAGAAAATPWWLAPAVLAGLIAAVVAVATLVVNGRRARIDRQRVLFADVLGDLAAYREFVYIVRRRRHDEPEAERVRISTELSEVQRKLNQHSAVLKVDAPRVAHAFDELVRVTRRVAGGAIHDGWNTPAITDDSGIHVDVDLTPIDRHEREYLTEVSDHLSSVPAFLRRRFRSLATAASGWRSRHGEPHSAMQAKSVA